MLAPFGAMKVIIGQVEGCWVVAGDNPTVLVVVPGEERRSPGRGRGRTKHKGWNLASVTPTPQAFGDAYGQESPG